MKSLLIVRHAKSSWDNISLSDFNRPLNHRGLRDAPIMANLAKTLGLIPEIIFSSPANRALTTATIFQNMFDNSVQIVENQDIYHASLYTLEELIQNFDDKYNHIAIFGHNPGLSFLAEIFTSGSIYEIPTCGIVSINFNCNHWHNVFECTKVFKNYFPKDAQD